MNLRPLLALAFISTSLSNCSHSVRPYSDKREAARVEGREVMQSAGQLAFDEGRVDGQSDRSNGEPDNYRRHSPMYTPATEKAYADGYREGYQSSAAATEPERDGTYNQGFDYGMRDRARGKPSDPDAYVGEIGARSRASFARGYLDGYNR